MPEPSVPQLTASRVAEEMGVPAEKPMTEEQAAEFRERFAEAAREWKPQIVPGSPSLALDEVRQLIRDCTPVVVKPGDALVIRKADLTPDQAREYQQALTCWHERGDLPFPVFVFVGDELGVVESREQP